MRGIVTLCGSTRFKEQFEEVNRRLTWSGWVVLSVGSFHHSEKDHSVADQIIKRKVKLDVLHKEKIDLSWAIVVINVGGYIGESTKSEIVHARKRGKTVFWYDVSGAVLVKEKRDVVDLEKDATTYTYEFDIQQGDHVWGLLLDESPDDLEPQK